MKQILALCILFCASVCWGVTGGSTTTYSKWPSVTDLESGTTNYLATLNAWKAMPAKTIISVSPLGGRIYVLDSGGCVFTYDRIARTYTQKAWGCGWAQITADFNPTANYFMIGLLKADAGCPSGTKRFYWSYNESAPSNTGFCAAQWYGSANHSQLQINETPGPNGGPSGHTWYWDSAAYHDMGTSWFTGGVSSAGACLLRWDTVTGGNATRVYFVGPNGTASLYSPQPPLTVSKGFTGGFTGCTINNDVIVVTDGAKSYMSDLTASTATWRLVTGAVAGIQGDSKATLFGIVSGNLRHLNVFAGYISATLQSTFTGCPDDTNPCPPSGVTHTRKIQVTLGTHGINGNLATYAGPPGATNQITTWDSNPLCDVFFGDAGDPECFANVNGDVICSVTGGSIYSPPPPPTCHDSQCGGFLNQQVEVANTKVELADKTPVPGSCIKEAVYTTCEYKVFPICSNTINPDYKPSVIRDIQWWPAWDALGMCIRDTKDGVPTEPWRCFKGVALETFDTSSAPCTYNPN